MTAGFCATSTGPSRPVHLRLCLVPTAAARAHWRASSLAISGPRSANAPSSAGHSVRPIWNYITTPIYYPNGEPHMGHVYTTRRRRRAGALPPAHGRRHVLPHRHRRARHQDGQDRRRREPRAGALADQNAPSSSDFWKELGITTMISSAPPSRGTNRRCRKSSADWSPAATSISAATRAGTTRGRRNSSPKPRPRRTNTNRHQRPAADAVLRADYFFRLKKYADRVLAHIESHPDFIQPGGPAERSGQQAEGGRGGSVHQPGHAQVGHPDAATIPAHVVYVWIDALSNYITALGYGIGR
jgi:methionyl-tRNA synthetase